MKTFFLFLILTLSCKQARYQKDFWLNQSEDIVEYSDDINPKIKEKMEKQNKKNKKIVKYNTKQDNKNDKRHNNTFDMH